jgi:putative nucleotidyltransferase with HDIG domain
VPAELLKVKAFWRGTELAFKHSIVFCGNPFNGKLGAICLTKAFAKPIFLLIKTLNGMTFITQDESSRPESCGSGALPKFIITRDVIAERIDQLASMPSLDAILLPLMSYLQQPFDQQDVQRIVDLVSHDNSLAAQCLHLANSPLYGRWESITNVRAAVIALGLQRMRDIALTCCVLKLIPSEEQGASPVVFWEHSLACALLARKFAKRIGMADPEHAYLGGLLHDIGLIVHLRLFPKEFNHVLCQARASGSPLHVIEESSWGCSHAETGSLLATKWSLTPVIAEVIQYHHCLSELAAHRSIIALVSLCDQICRTSGLGHGYSEQTFLQFERNELVDVLRSEYPAARTLNWAQAGLELTSYLNDVRKLVTALLRLA